MYPVLLTTPYRHYIAHRLCSATKEGIKLRIRTQSQENGWNRGQVEHGAPRSGRDDNIDHESSDNADADDELIDAAK